MIGQMKFLTAMIGQINYISWPIYLWFPTAGEIQILQSNDDQLDLEAHNYLVLERFAIHLSLHWIQYVNLTFSKSYFSSDRLKPSKKVSRNNRHSIGLY